MAQLPGVLVDPGATARTVTITDSHGGIPTVYSDPAGTTPVTMPARILAQTKFYLPGEGQWEVNGQIVTLEGSQVATVQLSVSTPISAYVTPGGVPYGSAAPVVNTIPAIYSHIGTGTQAALNYAKARGFTGISLNDYLDHLTKGAPIPPKPLLLSFDDEATQWTTVIDPILASFGWKATGCISCGYPDGEVMDLGGDPFFYTNTTPSTWAQIQALGQNGRWDWANHSRTHPNFIILTTAQRQAEWLWCQQRILAELNYVPRIFVHPIDDDSGATVADAIAFGFQLVVIGPQGYPDGNPLIGPGVKNMANLFYPNRTGGGYLIFRDAPDALASIEDVYEPVGNRVPDMPMTTGDPYGVWSVTAGTLGSGTNGVRMDQPALSGTMDFRSNGTGSVTAQTSQYIAVKPAEILRFAYFRQCGVSTGTYNVQVQEFDAYRNSLRTNTYETQTGTVTLGATDGAYTVGVDAWYVKLIVTMTSTPNGSFGTFQLPFFGSIR
jgi:peptidoglycan/xylan/chitin deacetylase (PgdA/CDA1 family)